MHEAVQMKALTSKHNGWLVVLLLFLIQMLNFFDKTVVGVAAASIMAELHISRGRYGLIAGALFFLYGASGLVVGFLAAPRFRPRTIMAVLLLVWSLSQIPIVLSASFLTLLWGRIVLGMGEGPCTPTAMNACHEWFASDERSMPTALMMLGSQIGSLLAAPALSYIIAGFGWRAAFLACSLIGFGILALWLLLSKDGPEAARPTTAQRTPGPTVRQRDLWSDPTVYGNFVAGFAAYWVVAFTVAWFPLFVRERLSLGIVEGGWVLSGVYLVQALVLLAVSWGSQRMLRGGSSSRVARGLVMAVSLLVTGAAFIGAATISDPVFAVALVAIGTSLPLVIFTLGAALISEVAPVEHRNRLMTIIYSIVPFSAILSPIVAGKSLSAGGGWPAVFLVLAAVAFTGGIVAWFTLRPERTLRRIAGLARI